MKRLLPAITLLSICLGLLAGLGGGWHSSVPVRAAHPGLNGKIVFTRIPENTNGAWVSEIWVMNADGSGEVRLTTGRGDFLPVWSPDGSKIGFASRPNSSTSARAYVINADGSGFRRLTTEDRGEGRPAWNADMSRVVLAASISGRYAIVTRNGDGSGPDTQITAPAEGESDTIPYFSPDGSKVLFQRQQGTGASASAGIYVVNTDGTGLTRISGAGDRDVQPDWSPDGTRIAFSNITTTGQYTVWIMNSDGTGRQQISPSLETMHQSAPAWSPDGTKIIYNRFLRVGATGSDIIAVGADGTGEALLTLPAGAGSHNYPNWGPQQAAPEPSPSPTASATATVSPTVVSTATPTLSPTTAPSATPAVSPTTSAPTQPSATAATSTIPAASPSTAPAPPNTGSGPSPSGGSALPLPTLVAVVLVWVATGTAGLLVTRRRKTEPSR